MEAEMKSLLAGLAVLVCIGCATVDNVKEFMNLDLAVAQSCQNIQSDFDEKASIAVLNIVSPSVQLSEYIIEEAMNSFTNMHKYNVLERNKISSVFQEQDFQMSGNVSDDAIQSIGNMLGAQFVVSGALDDVGNYYRLRLFVIAVESGERKSSTAVNIIKPNNQIDHLLTNAIEIVSTNIKVIKGYAAIFAEVDRILNDKDSPVIFVYSVDLSGRFSNAGGGVVFSTIEELEEEVREGVIYYSPDAYFEVKKISGEWALDGNNGFDHSIYKQVIEEVIDGQSAIAIEHSTKDCYILYWQ